MIIAKTEYRIVVHLASGKEQTSTWEELNDADVIKMKSVVERIATVESFSFDNDKGFTVGFNPKHIEYAVLEERARIGIS